jgi:DNA-binding MarR family transcriptional regulator
MGSARAAICGGMVFILTGVSVGEKCRHMQIDWFAMYLHMSISVKLIYTERVRWNNRCFGAPADITESYPLESSSSEDPLVCNGAVLRKATRRLSQLYDAALAPCGLSGSQRSILVHIKRAGSPTMTELAYGLVLDRSALARNIKPLERDGYLMQRPDDEDGRSRRVELTAAGRAKLIESNRLWRKAQRRFEEVYGVQRAASLRVALAEIYSDEFAAAFGAP